MERVRVVNKKEQPQTASRTPEEKINSLYVSKLTEGRVSAFIKVILSDPLARRKFYQYFEDRNAVIDPSEQDSLRKVIRKVTPLVSSIMRDLSLRSVFLEAVLGDMRERSDKLKEAIKSGQENAIVYDKTIIGAGIHAEIFNNEMTHSNIASKDLTIDRGDVVSGNFWTKGFVSVNTKNQPHTKEAPIQNLKKGNLNFLGTDAPLQVPDVESELYPAARSISEVATINQYLSNSETAFNTNAARIVFKEDDPDSDSWPAENKIFFEDGSFEYSDDVIITTGLGTPEYPRQFDAETLQVVKRDSLERQEGDEPPGIMTYEEFAEFLTDSYTPIRYFSGKKVDIAGGSDGAATVLEELFKLAKRPNYKLDVAQAGFPKEVHWVGQKIKDSRQYKNFLLNERYLMLASEMPLSEEDQKNYDENIRKEIDRKIKPIDGYLVQIRDSDDKSKGRYRVTYSFEGGAVQDSYTDFVILAAGYKNRMGQLFGKTENPFDDHEQAEVVMGEVNGVKVPIAVKLKGRRVYAAGPASIGKVLKDAEFELASLSGIASNKNLQYVDIATFGPRTEQLARQLAKNPVQNLKDFELPLPSPMVLEVDAENNKQYELDSDPDFKAPFGEELMDDIRIKVRIAKILDQCDIKGSSLEKLSVLIKKNPKNKRSVIVSFSPNIKNGQEIVSMMKICGLGDILVPSLQKGRWNYVVDIPFLSTGFARISAVNLRRE